jgi:glycosyltransferase involved in cell wall biosynthesis
VNIVEHHFTSLHSEDILNNPVNHFEKLKFKKNLGLSNRKMVLSIGQFIHRKGIDVLLNAWANLDENYQLVIVGGGEEKALYEEIIKELNLKNVTLVDFRPKAQIIKYYRAADLFVLPTREDIWGLVINEAMANGLPIVSTDKCIAALELIDDNGIIVPSDNPIALENAICGLLGNTQKLVDYSKTSLEIIQNHVVEDIGKSHVRVIQSVVG